MTRLAPALERRVLRSLGLAVAPEQSKYRNLRCDQPLPGRPGTRHWPDCGRHASHKQHRRYEELKLLERAGQVRNLREEVSFTLLPPARLAGERRLKPAWRYYADAVYDELIPGNDPALPDSWRELVEDTKSDVTRRAKGYRDKKHAMKSLLGIDIREV